MNIRRLNQSPPGAPDLTLKELRHVWLVHETLSFSRAAELAEISQSALSQSIAGIEKRLQLKLFQRDRRTVHSTAFARLIASQASQVLRNLNDMYQHVEALRDSREGSVSFGMGIFAANHLLDPVMRLFNQRYPEVQLHASVALVGELEAKLLRGDINFFVAARDPRFRDTAPQREPLYREEIVTACRPQHPLAGGGPVNGHQLIQYPIITYDSGYLRWQFHHELENAQEFKLLDQNFPAISMQQPWILVDFVAVSDYMIMASKSALARWLDRGDLITIPLEGLDMGVEMEVARRPGGLAPAEQRMLDVIREVVSNQQLQPVV